MQKARNCQFLQPSLPTRPKTHHRNSIFEFCSLAAKQETASCCRDRMRCPWAPTGKAKGNASPQESKIYLFYVYRHTSSGSAKDLEGFLCSPFQNSTIRLCCSRAQMNVAAYNLKGILLQNLLTFAHLSNTIIVSIKNSLECNCIAQIKSCVGALLYQFILCAVCVSGIVLHQCCRQKQWPCDATLTFDGLF